MFRVNNISLAGNSKTLHCSFGQKKNKLFSTIMKRKQILLFLLRLVSCGNR